MNKFEEVVVSDISAIKTETKNCQRACVERHENLGREIKDMKADHADLVNKLFDPKEGIITTITLNNARQGVIVAIASFLGTTLGVLVIGYVFTKVVH